MLNIVKYISLGFLLISQLNAFSQVASTSIHFPEEVNIKDIHVQFKNGLGTIDTIPVKASSLLITKPFYSRYAEIQVAVNSGTDIEHEFQFYVDDKATKLVFVEKDKKLVLEKSASNNFLTPDDLGRLTLEVITEPVYKRMQDFIEKDGDKLSDPLVASRGVQLAHELSNTTVDFIKSHSTSYFAFQSLMDVAPTDKYPSDSLVYVFEQFPVDFTSSIEGIEILETLKGYSLKAGMDAPHFVMRDIEGNPVDLNMYKGKHVLLNFWASWCVPCIAEMPAIVTIEKNTPKDKIELIFMSSDKSLEAMNRAIEKHGMRGVHIVSDNRIIQKYGAQAIPRLYLIDPDGKILYNREYDEKNPEKLESLINLVDKVKK